MKRQTLELKSINQKPSAPKGELVINQQLPTSSIHSNPLQLFPCHPLLFHLLFYHSLSWFSWSNFCAMILWIPLKTHPCDVLFIVQQSMSNASPLTLHFIKGWGEGWLGGGGGCLRCVLNTSLQVTPNCLIPWWDGKWRNAEAYGFKELSMQARDLIANNCC